MKLIFCIDDKKGRLCFGRRQSSDRALRAWVLRRAAQTRLWMSRYSAAQFENENGIIVDDDYAQKAEEADYCFVEDKAWDIAKANEIILCRWNRHYPADVFWTTDLKAEGFSKCESTDIVGSSHEKITIEVYRKK